MEEGGVKKYQKLRDVIHGRPLRLWFLDYIVLQLIIRLLLQKYWNLFSEKAKIVNKAR